MSWREDLVFGVVTDRKVIKEVQKKYGTKIFPDSFDLNSVIMHRVQNRFDDSSETIIMDHELSGVRDLSSWIAKHSLATVEEMNSLNQFAFTN